MTNKDEKKHPIKSFLGRMRMYVFRGVLALIPLVLCYFVLKFIYVFIDKNMLNIVDEFIGFRIPGLGVATLILFLYCIGILVSNVIGKQFFVLIEEISIRIPFIKSIYQVGKQISFSLSLPEKQVFKKAVLVDTYNNGVLAIGLVTGTVVNKKTNEKFLKVFFPTVPNPTTGFVFLVKETQTVDPGWTMDEAMKMIVSGGIIGPEDVR
jgi:uncharacterized membrane protein